MVEIPLSRGRVAIVDDVDADLAGFRWYCLTQKGDRARYAARKVPTGNKEKRQRQVQLHRLIADRMGLNVDRCLVDHKNGDGLDCRRENLREATNAENVRNGRAQRRSPTGLKGVYPSHRTWHARIHVGRRKVELGSYRDVFSAAIAYDVAARILHGEFARTNFPAFAAGGV